MYKWIQDLFHPCWSQSGMVCCAILVPQLMVHKSSPCWFMPDGYIATEVCTSILSHTCPALEHMKVLSFTQNQLLWPNPSWNWPPYLGFSKIPLKLTSFMVLVSLCWNYLKLIMVLYVLTIWPFWFHAGIISSFIYTKLTGAYFWSCFFSFSFWVEREVLTYIIPAFSPWKLIIQVNFQTFHVLSLINQIKYI